MAKDNSSGGDSFIRLTQILEIIPVSRSTWYRGVKAGIYPKQIKISEKISAWKLEDIRKCMEKRAGMS